VRRLRETRGERPIGRKIGFTNRTTWPDYAPMWGYVYDRTVHDLADIEGSFSLADLAEPRIEPEISFASRLCPRRAWTSAPYSGASTGLLLASKSCSRSFSGWSFTAPDAVAAFGVHGALLLGPWLPVTAHEEWEQALSTFTVDLLRDGEVVDRGQASNVLGDRSRPCAISSSYWRVIRSIRPSPLAR
jgi:2-oxo-3-hexenedioate decarboxylase